METPDRNPLTGLQGCLVAECSFLKAVRFVEGNAINPALLAGEGASRDGDAGISRQKLAHKSKVPICHIAGLVVIVISPGATFASQSGFDIAIRLPYGSAHRAVLIAFIANHNNWYRSGKYLSIR